MNDFSDLVLTFTSEEIEENNKLVREYTINEFVKELDDIMHYAWNDIENIAEKLKEQK